MGLSDVTWERRYKSSANPQDLLNDFFRPAISKSKVYLRGSGFFSSSMFTSIGKSLGDFIENGGRIRLITNVVISHEDVEAIEAGLKIERDFVQDEINRIINEDFRESVSSGTKMLTKLLEIGRLEIKIGVKKQGIYHEKIGIFFDEEVDLDDEFDRLKSYNHLAFFGSVNEGEMAWEMSHENFKVYPSWVDGRADDAHDTLQDFIDNWNGETSGLAVYDFDEAMKENLIRSVQQSSEREEPVIPQPVDVVTDNKWKHQDEAVEWFCNGKASGIGIFEMATGSGKTRTSMRCMKKMLDTNMCSKVIISVPKSLLRQWRRELTTFLGLQANGGTIAAIYEYSGETKHHNRFKRSVKNSFLLVSHTMLLNLLDRSKHWPPALLAETFCVIDEMHNVGSDRFRPEVESEEDIVELEIQEQSFSRFGCRLGLSATPWSMYDEENNRNRFLVQNFTRFPMNAEDLFIDSEWRTKLVNEKYVFRFGLEDGINRGILAEFDYIQLGYEPSDEEKSEYQRLARGARVTDDLGNSNILGAIRAASVFKGSREKIPVFKNWLEQNPQLDRTLIFVEDTAFGLELMEMVNSMGYVDFNKFFQGDDNWNLDRFASGETNFLVACHRISEGIDIQSVSQIILFSSATTQLETIQRIGRALRKGDEPKRAKVLDFIYEQNFADTNRRDWLIRLSEERNI